MQALIESPFLTQNQVDTICDGLTQKAAKVRYLRGLGLHVTVKPNGDPHVARSEYERVFGAARVDSPRTKTSAPGSEPDTSAAVLLLNRRSRHGAQAQRR